MSLNSFFGAIGVNCALWQFVAELRFCRQILFLARQDLRAAPAPPPSTAQWPLPAAAISAPSNAPTACSAAHVHSGTLVRTQSAGAVLLPEPAAWIRYGVSVDGLRNAGQGWCLCRPLDGPQISRARDLEDQHVAGAVFYVLTHAGAVT